MLKKIKFDYHQNYDEGFQKKFYKHYIDKNTLSKKIKKNKICIDLSNYIYDFKKYILNTLYEKKLITSKKINLEDIHRYTNLKSKKEKSKNDMTRNELTAAFFEKDKFFFDLYFSAIKEISKKLDFKFIFQKDPFLRFNLPTKSKIDGLLPHVDLGLGHPPGEINIWLPLTKTYKNNSLSISDFEKSFNFFKQYDFNFRKYGELYDLKIRKKALKILKPYVAQAGKALIFDGRIMHKSILNNSNKTRVSLDFRILPTNLEKRASFYKGTGYKKQKFKRAHYYYKSSI